MKAKIKRIDKELPLPQYQTAGAVAFDLCARIDAEIAPGEILPVPANIVVEVPRGYMMMIAARSSLSKKKGLRLANGVGIFDQDYCGPDDEVQIILHNFKDAPCQIKRGDRLAQGTFIKIEKADWEETDKISRQSRGGIGSTEGYRE